jgi:hypothetical protein
LTSEESSQGAKSQMSLGVATLGVVRASHDRPDPCAHPLLPRSVGPLLSARRIEWRGIRWLVEAQDRFFDLRVPRVGERDLRACDREPGLPQHRERSHVSLAVRANRGRTNTDSRSRASARLAMPCPQNDLSIQYVTSVLPSTTKPAIVPTNRPSAVMARMVISGDVLTFAMCTSNAVRSSGSLDDLFQGVRVSARRL